MGFGCLNPRWEPYRLTSPGQPSSLLGLSHVVGEIEGNGLVEGVQRVLDNYLMEAMEKVIILYEAYHNRPLV